MNIKSTNAIKNNSCKNITKEMLIGNVIKYCPETISMMMNHGINSFATHIIKQNTLERAAASNDINVGMLIYEINNKTNNRFSPRV